MKINELRPGGYIELRATIKEMYPIRKLWKCFECNGKGVWKTEDDFALNCPDCQAQISVNPGKGLWIQDVRTAIIEDDTGETPISLWHDDALKLKKGDKIHLINGYAKEGPNGIDVQAGRFGRIEVEK